MWTENNIYGYFLCPNVFTLPADKKSYWRVVQLVCSLQELFDSGVTFNLILIKSRVRNVLHTPTFHTLGSSITALWALDSCPLA